jgi:hypothetical protein
MDTGGVDSEAQEEKMEVVANIRVTSISEAAEAAATGGFHASIPLKLFEIPFRVKNPKDGQVLPEAVGWAMDAAAQGPLVQVGGYVGAAILHLAVDEVRCQAPWIATIPQHGVSSQARYSRQLRPWLACSQLSVCRL